MKKALNYHKELIKRLKNPEHSLAYLNAALMDEDPMIFLIALKNVIEAHGGIGKISKKADLNRESMYKTLSGKRDPRISTVSKILDGVGIELRAFAKS